jgi:MoaA/NifB/PqqE/SkfB family radical SAM enzyme
MTQKFKVISLHMTCDCDLNCPFCYAFKGVKSKPKTFWYGLIPYIKKLAPQVAAGGGELFTDPKFVREFSMQCMAEGLIFNITTNGRALMKMNDTELAAVLRYITMVSISFDEFKVQSADDVYNYMHLVHRIHKLTHCQVGCNLLVTPNIKLVNTVVRLFSAGAESYRVDRVYALHPKNMPHSDILARRDEYVYLTGKYERFYVDDLSKMVLEEKTYGLWDHPCHFMRDMVSINQKGEVLGCSFDKEPLLTLKRPEDLLKIRKVKYKPRYLCPYVIK